MDPKENEIRMRIFDEIGQHARSKMAEGLKSKYSPKPKVEEAPQAPEQSDELDAESLARLAEMAGE